MIALLQKIFLAKGSDLGPGLVIPRTIIVFAFAILFIRLARKRSIAQASAMDMLLIVLFGSILSRAVNGGATLLSSLVAGSVLIAMQRVMSHYACASKRFADTVKGTYEVLIRDGVPDREQMRQHDISEDDLKSEMRINGLVDDFADVKLAVLERSGRISVVRRDS